MSRWQISKIIIYSYDNRYSELELYPDSVNIIVGDSNTGKSALVEIINYTLGSNECLIPDHVQLHCSWVAIQLTREKEYCFIARKLPPIGKSRGLHIYDVRNSTSPNYPKNTNDLKELGKSALHRLEELLGIGQFSLFEDSTLRREKLAISQRHIIPFILLSDDVIINKSKLFWDGHGPGAGHRAQNTIDTLPYFLGILDEEKLRKKKELQNLKREYRRLEREVKETERIVSVGTRRVDEFLQKAKELGMITDESDGIKKADKVELLNALANWEPASSDFQPSGELPTLRLEEQKLRSQLNELEKKKKSVRRVISNAEHYEMIIDNQSNRLDAINLFESDGGNAHCPLCNEPIGGKIETIMKMRETLESLAIDVGEVKSDRPRLDGYLNQISEESEQVRQKYRDIQSRIVALVAQDEKIQKLKSLSAMRQHLAGMVDMFLQSKKVEERTNKDSILEQLKDQINLLEDDIDDDAIANSMEAISQKIAYDAKRILEKLPFEEQYKRSMVIFDYKKLQSHLLDGTRTIQMPVIGSDENYLALHISIFIALHRIFSENHRPVPGFIFMDQISRPYFPADKYQDVVRLKDELPARQISLMDERKKVNKIFKVLFSEVKKSDSFQIIVCEKAYFSDDSRYKGGVRAFWNKPKGLVPDDWPQYNKGIIENI